MHHGIDITYWLLSLALYARTRPSQSPSQKEPPPRERGFHIAGSAPGLRSSVRYIAISTFRVLNTKRRWYFFAAILLRARSSRDSFKV